MRALRKAGQTAARKRIRSKYITRALTLRAARARTSLTCRGLTLRAAKGSDIADLSWALNVSANRCR